jgi:isopentenyl-diphosphate delta-isomerase
MQDKKEAHWEWHPVRLLFGPIPLTFDRHLYGAIPMVRLLRLILSVEIVIIFLTPPILSPDVRMPKKSHSRSTPSRKKQHIDITLTKDVRFRSKTTGLGELQFIHNALPEVNLSEVNTSVEFLHRKLALPFMVSCMTGGFAGALVVNRQLAEVCEEVGIAMGVGSQRQALEDEQYHRTFSVVREMATTIPVIGNIGAAEVARMTNADAAKRLVDLIRADAFAVHLNPLQEFLQPEGDTNFRGVIEGIAKLVEGLPVPVIVKEIGAGISHDVARRLIDVGVRYIDVAGAGGTSWAGVETLRRGDKTFASQFWDWGIPTATALRDVARLRSEHPALTVIASGGITSGIDAAKCIALGADLVASARPILSALYHGKKKGLRNLLRTWEQELRGIMFLTGAADIPALQKVALAPCGAT